MPGERLVGLLYMACIVGAVYEWYKWYRGDDLKK